MKELENNLKEENIYIADTENFVILKWGSLKAYNFSDKFYNENKTICEEFVNVWKG